MPPEIKAISALDALCGDEVCQAAADNGHLCVREMFPDILSILLAQENAVQGILKAGTAVGQTALDMLTGAAADMTTIQTLHALNDAMVDLSGSSAQHNSCLSDTLCCITRTLCSCAQV